eukprot:TRINITY_DN3596_c0_g2_i1.p1 TRINITY_DN3596_c0_g2~~TRINITY_DN3596_c0_g2_i1.p1  ORF type:complete len:3631 (+),score=1051.57 TRINITY_DN3596_c0_g2_i1:56-10948(+)
MAAPPSEPSSPVEADVGAVMKMQMQVAALRDHLEHLGVTVRKGEYDKDTVHELEAVRQTYDCYFVLLSAIRELDGTVWAQVNIGTLEACEDAATEATVTHESLPDDAHSLPTYREVSALCQTIKRQCASGKDVLKTPLRAGHWMRLLGEGCGFDEDDQMYTQRFSLRNFFSATATPEGTMLVTELVTAAQQESAVRKTVKAIKEQLFDKKLPIVGGSLDMTAARQLVAELGDLRTHAMLLMDSEHAHASADVCDDVLLGVRTLKELLATLAENLLTLDELTAVLKHPQVREQLSLEAGLLAETKERLDKFVSRVAGSPDAKAGALLGDPAKCENLGYELDDAAELLARAQHLLQQRVSTACENFPRFHFVDEPVLLELIAVTGGDVAASSRFLPQVFSNVHSLVSAEGDPTEILGVVSPEGERLLFSGEPLQVSGSFDEWAPYLDARLRCQLADSLRQVGEEADRIACGKGQVDRTFMDRYPASVCLAGLHMAWTSLVEGTLGVVPQWAPPPPSPAPEPGLASVSRPQSAMSLAATSPQGRVSRPVSALRYVPPRPSTASGVTPDQRLKQLTRPLSADAAPIRPGSAPAKGKVRHVEAEEKPKRTERRRSSGRGRSALDKRRGKGASSPVRASVSPPRGASAARKRRSVVRPASSAQRPQSALRISTATPCSTNVRELRCAVSLQLDDFDRDSATVSMPGTSPITSPRREVARETGGSEAWQRRGGVTSCGAADARRRLKAIHTFLIDMTTKHLPMFKRAQLESSATLFHHLMGQWESKELQGAPTPKDFEWQCRPRLYKPAAGGYQGCIFRMSDAIVPSGLEFQGCRTRSILTPQTQRAWLNLSQAVALNQGGLAIGPDSTEVVQDLAGVCAKFAPVMEGGPGGTLPQVTSFVVGVAAGGCWGIIKDVCRLPPSVVANVVALTDVLRGALERAVTNPGLMVPIGGQVHQIVPGGALFSTVSAIDSKGIPSELRAQYRVVAIAESALLPAAETMLAGVGFKNAAVCARKLTVLFGFLKERVQAAHVHLGARTVVRVATRAAVMLRNRTANTREKQPLVEDLLVMRAARHVIGSSLTEAEKPVFLQALTDVFPTQHFFAQHLRVEEALSLYVRGAPLTATPNWTGKVLELYEAQTARQAMLLLGGAGHGKTTATRAVLRVLQDVCCMPFVEARMFPSALPSPRVWGLLNPETLVWEDGVFALHLQQAMQKTKEALWLVLDGPLTFYDRIASVVSPEECFRLPPYQQQIPLPPSVKIAIETDDVADTTPAQLSRLSTVYFGSSVVGWRGVVEAWVFKGAHEGRALAGAAEHVMRLCDTQLLSALAVAARLGATRGEGLVTRDMLALLDGVLRGAPAATQGAELRIAFLWALSWAATGELSVDNQIKFFSEVAAEAVTGGLPKGCSTLLDCKVEPDGTLAPCSAAQAMALAQKAKSAPGAAALTTAPALHGAVPGILRLMQAAIRPVAVIGPRGCGKSHAVTSFCEAEKLTLRCLSAAAPHNHIASELRAAAGCPAASGSNGVAIVVEDIGHNNIGDVPGEIANLAEVLRCIIHQGGVPEVEQASTRLSAAVQGVSYFCTSAPRNAKSVPRLMRHFVSVCVKELPNGPHASRAYSGLLRACLAQALDLADVLCAATVKVLQGLVDDGGPHSARVGVKALKHTATVVSMADHSVAGNRTNLLALWAAAIADSSGVPDYRAAALCAETITSLVPSVKDVDAGALTAAAANLSPFGDTGPEKISSRGDIGGKLREVLGDWFVPYGSFCRMCSAIGRALAPDGSSCVVEAPSGSGRKLAAVFVAKALGMELTVGVSSAQQIEAAVKAAAKGRRVLVVIPEDELCSPECQVRATALLTTGDHDVLDFSEQLQDTITKLAEEGGAQIEKRGGQPESSSDAWRTAWWVVRAHMRVLLCTSDVNRLHEVLPAAAAAPAAAVRGGGRSADAVRADAGDAVAAALGAPKQGVALALARVHQWALSATENDTRKRLSAHCSPSKLPQAAKVFAEIYAREQQRLKVEQDTLQVQQSAALTASLELGNRTGVMPVIHDLSPDTIPFDGEATHPKHGILPVRMFMVVDAPLQEDRQPGPIRGVSGVAVYIAYGKEEDGTLRDHFGVQGHVEAKYQVGGTLEMVTGKPEAGGTMVTGTITWEVEAPEGLLDGDEPEEEEGQTAEASDANQGKWVYRGTFVDPLGAPDVGIPFEVASLAVSGETPITGEWLKTKGEGSAGGGYSLEPDWVREELTQENRAALAQEIQTMIETDRARLFARRAEVDEQMAAVAGDALCAAVLEVYGPALPPNSRRPLIDEARAAAKENNIPLLRSMLDDGLGVRAMCAGVKGPVAATQWFAARKLGLPAGEGWDDLVQTVANQPHFLPERNDPVTGKTVQRVRFPFFYDPNGVIQSWVRQTEESLCEEGGPADVVCMRSQDPSLEGTFVECVQRGRSLIVEGVEPKDWARLRLLTSLRIVGGETGLVACDLPGWPEEGINTTGNFRMVFLTECGVFGPFPPQVHSACRFVNCAVTPEGLESMICRTLAMAEQDVNFTDLEDALRENVAAIARVEATDDLYRKSFQDIDVDDAVQIMKHFYQPHVKTMLLQAKQHQESLAASESSVRGTEERCQSVFDITRLPAQRAALLFGSVEATADSKSEAYRLDVRRVLVLATAVQEQQPRATSEKARSDQLVDRLVSQFMTMSLRTMPEIDRVGLAFMYALRLDSQGLLDSAPISAGFLHSVVCGSSSLSVDDQLAYEKETMDEITTEHRKAVAEWKARQEEVNRLWQEEQDRLEREEIEMREAAAKRGKPPRPGSAPKQQAGKKKAGKGPEKLPQPQRQLIPFKVRPAYHWLGARTWLNLVVLSQMDGGGSVFSRLLEILHDREKHPKNPRAQRWQEWVTALGPKVPDFDKGALGRFERLALTLAARPDRALLSLHKYVSEVPSLNDPFAQLALIPPELFQLTSPQVPMVFLRPIAQTDAESLDAVIKLSTTMKKDFPPNARIIMQQGLEAAVLDLVRRSMDTGTWVYLADAHAAAPGFLDSLATELRTRTDPHESFRLFITSAMVGAPTDPLPIVIRDGVRVLLTEPRGVKAMMNMLYRGLEENTLAAFCTVEWQRLVFGVLFVIALLRERRMYAPEGFVDSNALGGGIEDAFAAVSFLHRHLCRLKSAERHKDALIALLSWDTVRNSLTELLSSGVTSSTDRLVVRALVDWWVHPDVLRPGMRICKGVQMPGRLAAAAGKEDGEAEEVASPTAKQASVLSIHKQVIEGLPAIDQTELFGLPPICDLASQKRIVEQTFTLIRGSPIYKTPPGDSVSLAVENFLSRLPEPWTSEAVDAAARAGYACPPKPYSAFNACLAAELTDMCALLSLVRAETQSSSPVGEACRRDLVMGQVPASWKKDWRANGIGVWLALIRRACVQLEAWRNARRVPVPLWLGGLAAPARLLGACRQEQARAHKRSLADSTLRTQVLPPRRAPAPGFLKRATDTLVLADLLLQGCAWNAETRAVTEAADCTKQWWLPVLSTLPLVSVEVVFPPELESTTPATAPRLRDLRPKGAGRRDAWGPRPGTAPPAGSGAAAVVAAAKAEIAADESEGPTVAMPVYCDASRAEGSRLFDVDLPCGTTEPNHWILRGAALLARNVQQ